MNPQPVTHGGEIMPDTRCLLLATEVLLSAGEELRNDPLEVELWAYRDRLRAELASGDQS